MKKHVYQFIALMLLLAMSTGVLCACKKKDEEPFVKKEYTLEERTAARAVQLAKTTLDNYIDAVLYEEEEIYLYDAYNPFDKEQDGSASVWHYTSVIAMTNRLAAITSGEDEEYFNKYNSELWRDIAWYRGTAKITSYRTSQDRTLYGVNRAYTGKDNAAVKGINAVYDDQMWIIRELLSAYANTGKTEYLQEAETLTDTCLDGWDDTINPETNAEFGGITWGPGYASKHTCSNAPLIAPLVDLYLLYKGKNDTIYSENKADYYLNWAKKIYDFSYATFKNANDLYGDLVGSIYVSDAQGLKMTVSQGDLDITEYTYNTGTMIQGGAKLYSATGDKLYLTQAQNSADAAYRIFGAKDAATGLSEYPTTSTLWFNFELLLGFVELAYADDSEFASVNKTYVDSFREALDYAYDNYYYDGFLPRNYVKGWTYGTEFDTNKNVMDSAAGAEMYALLYQYYTKIKA